MGQASRDENRVTTLLAVSSADGTTPVTLYANPTTHRLLTSASGGAAPSDATYVVLSANATLTDERILTGTANQITITDNGAGSTVVLSLPQSIATSSTPTFASMTLTGASSLTLGTASTNAGAIILKNATNANTATIVSGVTSASYSVTWPTAQSVGTQVLTNDGTGVLSWATNGTGTVTSVSVVTANGVSGSVATATTTPAITLTLGDITPSKVNGLTISSSTGTLTITNGKTFSVAKTLTLDGTDGTTMTFPTTSATLARTDAANAFTGASTASAWVLTSPTITTSIVPTANDGAALGSTGNQFSDLFLAEGGVINWDNGDLTLTQSGDTLTLAGGVLSSPNVLNANNAIAASGNAATVPITHRLSTVTNNSAATLTVTLTTSGAIDGQMLVVRVLDASGVAQTITWVNTENSTVIAPTTSNGSTTLPLTVGFMFNGSTSKWRTVASA